MATIVLQDEETEVDDAHDTRDIAGRWPPTDWYAKRDLRPSSPIIYSPKVGFMCVVLRRLLFAAGDSLR